jgi:hypothetical protein
MIRTLVPTRRHASAHRAAMAFFIAASVLSIAGCSGGRRRLAVPAGGPRILTVPKIERMMQMGTAPSAIVDEIQRSGTVYNLTAQQTKDLRAVGMPVALINQMQLTYQNAIRRNPRLATSGNYWTQVDGYWYGGIPVGWPRDWVTGATAGGEASR